MLDQRICQKESCLLSARIILYHFIEWGSEVYYLEYVSYFSIYLIIYFFKRWLEKFFDRHGQLFFWYYLSGYRDSIACYDIDLSWLRGEFSGNHLEYRWLPCSVLSHDSDLGILTNWKITLFQDRMFPIVICKRYIIKTEYYWILVAGHSGKNKY